MIYFGCFKEKLDLRNKSWIFRMRLLNFPSIVRLGLKDIIMRLQNYEIIVTIYYIPFSLKGAGHATVKINCWRYNGKRNYNPLPSPLRVYDTVNLHFNSLISVFFTSKSDKLKICYFNIKAPWTHRTKSANKNIKSDILNGLNRLCHTSTRH